MVGSKMTVIHADVVGAQRGVAGGVRGGGAQGLIIAFANRGDVILHQRITPGRGAGGDASLRLVPPSHASSVPPKHRGHGGGSFGRAGQFGGLLGRR